MRFPRSKSRRDGIVWLEVLVILLVLMLVVVVLIPYLKGGGPSKGVACMNNQKQISLGFMMWCGDNGDKYPWQISETNHGAMEDAARGDAAAGIKTLGNYVQWMPVFVCPTDPVKIAATNMASLGDQNLSYFIGLDGMNGAANFGGRILTGDRHLWAGGVPVKPGLFTYTTNTTLGWTSELHYWAAPMGVLSFYDGHCQVITSTNINPVFQGQGLATARFAVP